MRAEDPAPLGWQRVAPRPALVFFYTRGARHVARIAKNRSQAENPLEPHVLHLVLSVRHMHDSDGGVVGDYLHHR